VFNNLPLIANQAWLQMIADVTNYGDSTNPRGQGTKEILGYQSCIDMRYPMLNVAGRIEGKFHAFMLAEALWILKGDNRVESISYYSKMISKFSDDGRYFGGAYGPKIVDQLTYVVDKLIEDPDTRQAVINIWRENPRSTKDTPCTLSLQFLIRNGRLNCSATMRSSDAWLGWPFDVFNFSMISNFVNLLIQERVIKGGNKTHLTNLKPGVLRLTAGSQHIYERNVEKVAAILASDGVGLASAAFQLEPADPEIFGADPDLLTTRLVDVRDACVLSDISAEINGTRELNREKYRQLIDWRPDSDSDSDFLNDLERWARTGEVCGRRPS